jgi:superfamily II DNA or RNA helicase
VVKIARRKLAAGKRRLHIVAPPGSGKTVLGLYLWTDCVRRPALVLSPNSAIQAQWADKIELFSIAETDRPLVSTDSQQPALLTSLTYQSVTLPGRGGADEDAPAIDLWQDKLIEAGQAKDPEEAAVWIEDLRRHNREYYEQRLRTYRKQVRDGASVAGGSLELLHASSLLTLQRLKEFGVGLIILDECHHLMGHWGRVLADAHDLLDQPIVIGLTATPPDRDGKKPEDIQRYDEFFGEVDYEVPVPAVVKDGFLAPYQDLAYFVRPTREELTFIANADEQLHELVAALCRPEGEPGAAEGDEAARRGSPDRVPAQADHAAAPSDIPSTGEPLSDWLIQVLGERRLPTGVVKDWDSFEKRDPAFALAARTFLLRRGHPLPPETPPPEHEFDPDEVPEMATLTPVLDRYVRHHLRRSADAANRELADQVVRKLRMLGVQITETGAQACASPVARVMAYSQSKTEALAPILSAEHRRLGARLRAVVVADFEKSSAVSAEVEHLLDAEAGGAIAAFKQLLRHPETDALHPILVTGSSVLVDDDLAPAFDAAAQQWLATEGYEVELELGEEDGFHVIRGRGSDWCPRVYVALITDLFQAGLTKCLVGTRGLLGEGWDASKINVLIDLTTVTTSMTVNQLRGRSIRLDADDPQKLANNWDVVCLAPEFSKGLDDYQRFIAKHKTLFGITDDGAIEKGVGHVHPAFTELKPEGLEGSTGLLNTEMLARAGRRDEVRDLWKIGQPYSAEPIRALETSPLGGSGGFPPFKGAHEQWNDASLALAIGKAVLLSLCDAELLGQPGMLHVGQRSGGYVRLFLEQARDEEAALFTQALHEALGPLDRPRYVIPRSVHVARNTWLSAILPAFVGRYFQRREQRRVMLHAVPSVLARNKDLVAIFEAHWNRYVSPGQAIYAHHGPGKDLVAQARRQGWSSKARVHEKEIFL